MVWQSPFMCFLSLSITSFGCGLSVSTVIDLRTSLYILDIRSFSDIYCIYLLLPFLALSRIFKTSCLRDPVYSPYMKICKNIFF